jgi:signal transduction histidine kinase
VTWTKAARTWRAIGHALVGLPLGVMAFALTGGLPIGLAYCAGWSLLYAPAGDRLLTTTFVVLAVLVPVPVWWTVRGLTMLQRWRFRALLGAGMPPPQAGPRGTWRQIGYHLLAPFIGAGFWLALPLALAGLWDDGRPLPVNLGLGVLVLLAAPWVARAVARADTAVARALLGPSRGEALSARVESLSRSRADIIAATDAERRRIERDLHDGAQQRLVSLAMNLGMARAGLGDTPGPARQVIEAAHEEAVQALAEMREFVRGLHPAVLDDRGLDAALSGIAARAPLPVRVRVTVPSRCSPVIEAIAYFVVSEGLTNVAKHAGATRAEVTVDRSGDLLRVAVTDDGRGGADRNGGGLRGLAQRAAAVDGTFALHSPPGGPTTITVELPCAS